MNKVTLDDLNLDQYYPSTIVCPECGWENELASIAKGEACGRTPSEYAEGCDCTLSLYIEADSRTNSEGDE